MGFIRVIFWSYLIEVACHVEHPSFYVDHRRRFVLEQVLVVSESFNRQRGRHYHHFQWRVFGWVLLRFLVKNKHVSVGVYAVALCIKMRIKESRILVFYC